LDGWSSQRRVDLQKITLTGLDKKILSEHSENQKPNEACAILFGKNSLVSEVFLTKNIEESPVNFTISNDLPRLGYLTFLDTILVSTFIVTALVIMFNVYLKRLEVDNKKSRAQKVDKYMIWLYPIAYFVAFGIVSYFFT